MDADVRVVEMVKTRRATVSSLANGLVFFCRAMFSLSRMGRQKPKGRIQTSERVDSAKAKERPLRICWQMIEPKKKTIHPNVREEHENKKAPPPLNFAGNMRAEKSISFAFCRPAGRVANPKKKFSNRIRWPPEKRKHKNTFSECFGFTARPKKLGHSNLLTTTRETKKSWPLQFVDGNERKKTWPPQFFDGQQEKQKKTWPPQFVDDNKRNKKNLATPIC